MASRINRLDHTVSNRLQSHVTINTFNDAIQQLIENSVDAGADEVEIRIDFRTLSCFVKDNGSGIKFEDLPLVGKRYHTSKLNSNQFITTLGYRGEALHSLKSIGDLSIFSKYIKCDAYMLYSDVIEPLNEDQIESDLFRIGDLAESGTAVILTNLFLNLPVRRRQELLVSENRIVERLKQTLLCALIIHPGIKFSIFKTEQETKTLVPIICIDFEDDPDRSLSSMYATAFKSVFGSKLLSSYETVTATFQDYKLAGVVGTYSQSTKVHQYIFINGKLNPITNEQSKTINRWFSEADFEMETPSPTKTKRKSFYSFPVFLVNIECSVDIDNLTTFQNTLPNPVFQLLEKVFKSFLKYHGFDRIKSLSPEPSSKRRELSKSPPKMSPRKMREAGLSHPFKELPSLGKNIPSLDAPTKSFMHYPPTLSSEIDRLDSWCKPDNFQDYGLEKRDETQLSRADFIQGDYTIVGQADKKFILICLNNKSNDIDGQDFNSVKQQTILMALDQHACDERIKVEEILHQFILQLLDSNVNIMLKLVEPLQLEVTEEDKFLYSRYKANLKFFGIAYSIQPDNILVTHMPHILLEKVGSDNIFLNSCLLQHFHDLKNKIKQEQVTASPQDWFSVVRHLPRIIIEIINSKACRSSIMFGDELSKEEMAILLKKLGRTNLPFQCAHGRPSTAPIANLKDYISE